MSHNTKSRTNKNMQRRSALSFDGADGSLDVDPILQSDAWKNVEIFETSEVTRIQNVLNDFDNIIIQDKILKQDRTTAKKSSRKSPRTTKKSAMKSPIKNSTMDLPGTSSSTNNNIETNEKKKRIIKKHRERASTKLQQTSKEVTIPRELVSNIDNIEEKIQKCPKTNVEENVNSIKKQVKKINLSNQTYITNLQTSTPKQELPKTIKKTAKKEKSTAEDKEPKLKDSENKLKKNIQRKEKQKTLKKNAKDKQDESSVNMPGKEKKTSVKLENNLECNEVNQKASKNKVEDSVMYETAQCCAMFSSEMEKKHTKAAEINNNIEKNAKLKEYNKNIPNESKKKNKKEKEKGNFEDKLPKSAKSTKFLKSSQTNNAENAKCQCKKNCAKRSDGQSLLRTKEQIEKKRQHKKSIRAARAIDELSRRITVVKRKMTSIKNDLVNNESSDSDSSYSDGSSYSSRSSNSTYSSSSYSYDSISCGCSCTSCSCYCTSDDYTEYTLNSRKSLISTESSGDSSESDNQTKRTSKKEGSH